MKSHLAWIIRFLLFHSGKHPCDCGEIDLASLLEHLANNLKVSRAYRDLPSLLWSFSSHTSSKGHCD
ncbi:MAG: phage integrase N-terminal SAM-like domain-containing protein [Candidatus Thiodiazotropha sp. LLP2]